MRDVEQRLDWTPVDASAAGLVFTGVSGRLEKHGRTVIARASLTFPVTADGASVQIGGLPFRVSAESVARQGFISWTNEPTLMRCMPLNNGNTIELFTAAGVNLTNAAMSGKLVAFTVIYHVDQ